MIFLVLISPSCVEAAFDIDPKFKPLSSIKVTFEGLGMNDWLFYC
jgi:hypothetical protein